MRFGRSCGAKCDVHRGARPKEYHIRYGSFSRKYFSRINSTHSTEQIRSNSAFSQREIDLHHDVQLAGIAKLRAQVDHAGAVRIDADSDAFRWISEDELGSFVFLKPQEQAALAMLILI